MRVRASALRTAPDGEAVPPHERIVAAARELFCRDGIHATGIDRILSEAGASKMTLYGRFGSKDALVREVLRREGEEWRATLFARMRAAGPEPLAQLGHVVAALAAWFHGGRFYGCAFMNASAEHTKGEPWLRELAAAHAGEVWGVLHGLAREAGLAEPELLARQVLLVIDGTVASLMVGGDAAVLGVAERTLRAVLRQGG